MWAVIARTVGLVVIAGVACSPAAPAPTTSGAVTSEQRSANQLFRYGVNLFPPNPNPIAVSSGLGNWYTFQFDSLVLLDDKLKLQPSLASSWELLPDNSAFRFTLRKDVTWADGSAVTAADVDFTFATIIANKFPQVGSFPNLSGTKVVDATTVDLLLKAPDVSVLYNSASLPIVPKAYYERVGTDGFTAKPMGSGPYELAEYRSNALLSYKLRPTPHAFRKPVLSEVRIQAVTEASAALAGLRSGELDMHTGPFNPDQADAAKTEGLNLFVSMANNTTLTIAKGVNDRNRTPLTDKRVRQALNYAVDKEAISKTIFRGYAAPVGQLSIPTSLLWSDANRPFPYDPAKAKALLAEAGYPNGFTLAGGMDIATSFFPEAVALAVQGYFKDIGVDARINNFEIGTYTDRAYGRNGLTTNELLFNNTGDPNGMFVLGRTFFTCPLQLTCVPEFDRLLNQAYAEGNEAKRAELLRAANTAFVADTPLVFLVTRSSIIISSQKLKGQPTPGGSWIMDTIYRVD